MSTLVCNSCLRGWDADDAPGDDSWGEDPPVCGDCWDGYFMEDDGLLSPEEYAAISRALELVQQLLDGHCWGFPSNVDVRALVEFVEEGLLSLRPEVLQ